MQIPCIWLIFFNNILLDDMFVKKTDAKNIRQLVGTSKTKAIIIW